MIVPIETALTLFGVDSLDSGDLIRAVEPWITNGHFAVHVGEGVASKLGRYSFDSRSDRKVKVATILERGPKFAATEDHVSRIAYRPAGGEMCRECAGVGTHECDCGDEHDCRHCRGKGRRSGRELEHGALYVVNQELRVRFAGCVATVVDLAHHLILIPQRSTHGGDVDYALVCFDENDEPFALAMSVRE